MYIHRETSLFYSDNYSYMTIWDVIVIMWSGPTLTAPSAMYNIILFISDPSGIDNLGTNRNNAWYAPAPHH